MSENRYQPPNAEVTDRATHGPARPKAVRLACQLLLISVALSLATLLPGIRVDRPDDAETPLAFALVVGAILLSLSLWLIAKSYEGKNWARWANLAYLAIGWWFATQEIGPQFLASPVAGAIEFAVILMELAACGLLFFGIGNFWFNEVARARRASPNEP
jgi:hypothetical protein